MGGVKEGKGFPQKRKNPEGGINSTDTDPPNNYKEISFPEFWNGRIKKGKF